jgi:hypothetical protein
MIRRLSPAIRQYVDAVACLVCAVAFLVVFFVLLDSL